MSALAEIRTLIAAASETTHGGAEALFVAMARAKLAAVSRELAEVDRLVTSREVEIGRRARDITQLGLLEREAP